MINCILYFMFFVFFWFERNDYFLPSSKHLNFGQLAAISIKFRSWRSNPSPDKYKHSKFCRGKFLFSELGLSITGTSNDWRCNVLSWVACWQIWLRRPSSNPTMSSKYKCFNRLKTLKKWKQIINNFNFHFTKKCFNCTKFKKIEIQSNFGLKMRILFKN